MTDSPSPAPADPGPSARKLTAHVQAIEALEAEKAATAAAIKDRYAQAKAEGFDPAMIRLSIKHRADETKALAKDETLATYLHAIRQTEAATSQSKPEHT